MKEIAYNKHSAGALAFVLLALVLAVYWRTTGFDFISLDDYQYVTRNPLVLKGLSFSSFLEGLTAKYVGQWNIVPLTWISYMADVSASGLDPGAFHRTNVLLYLATVLSLFFFLRSATGSTWKSFFAAALWAMHPMRVESVAWIAERKDVLSGLFFILSLWSWLNYTRTRRTGWYAAAVTVMVLGLLAKPILVVLPVAMVLLDYWPLNRFPKEGKREERLRGFKSLAVEKIPFFLLSLTFVIITYYTQVTAKTEDPLRPFYYGFANASTAYWKYLGRTLFPSDLMLQYDVLLSAPGTVTSPPGPLAAFASLAALIAATFVAYRLRKKVPELAFGWFWFLLVLFPNSGIVPTGIQSFADRFTYLPHLGIAMGLVFGAARLAEGSESGRKLLVGAGVALVAVLALVSVTFTGYWKNSFTLFGHIDEIYGGKNELALVHLSNEYMDTGDLPKVIHYLDKLLAVSPTSLQAMQNKTTALCKQGRYDDALEFLYGKLRTFPGNKEIISLVNGVRKKKEVGR